ncbi:MAG TPA: hypothetical protein VK675_04915 [Candidatus Paceibacterota bacterium]|nr:hypothetical protein [Candidatus Paceibacterota bacterium]
MDEIIDLLKIKIEKAKANLSTETVNAIAAVDWKAAILGLRAKFGYTFEQLGDLEVETELLLSGLVSPENYPKELSNRMKISSTAANELVNEMNKLVFSKIREELVKNAERKKIFSRNSNTLAQAIESAASAAPSDVIQTKKENVTLGGAGINIIPEKLELTTAGKGAEENREDMLKNIEEPESIHPILEQKLSSSFQIPMAKTEHSLDNITKNPTPAPAEIIKVEAAKIPVPPAPKIDPYREIPE